MRFGIAAASWVVVAWLSEGALGAELGGACRKLEERIELQLRGGARAPQPQQPQRTHEDSIEPWELVSV